METKLARMSSGHYALAFQVFCAHTDERSTSKIKWRESVFSELVVPIIRIAKGEVKELQVFGVGVGSGETECGMLEKLLSRFPSIDQRVLEPDEKAIAQFKILTESKSHQLHGVNFEWQQQTLEQYQSEGDPKKFDFISALHVMYHLDDWENSLMFLYDHLEPGGILRIDMIAGTGGMALFCKRFGSLLKGCHFIASTDILDSLDRHGIPYTLHQQQTTIDITKCFDETSGEGGLLLDFISQVEDFREAAPMGVKTQVMDFLASSDCTEKIGGNVLFHSGYDIIIATKQTQ